MSWVCDTCSCNNDDDVLECFVCGSHRSEASIREAERRLREKKMDDFSEMLYSKVFGSIKIGTIVVGTLFVVVCIFRILQGNLFTDLEVNTNAIINTSSFQAKLFVDRWSNFDVLGGWVSKTEIVTWFMQSLDMPFFFKEAVLSMFGLLSSNMLLIYSNLLCMLPIAKFDHFVIIYETLHNNILLIVANAATMVPSTTKFDAFFVINNKMTARGSYFENVYQDCLNTASDKFIGIKSYTMFIVDIVQSNIERALLIIDSIVHRGTISLQCSGNYINRVVSKFRK